MAFKLKLDGKWLNRLGGLAISLIIFVAGIHLLDSDPNPQVKEGPQWDRSLSQALVRKSYDFSFDLTRFAQPDLKDSDVVIIYIDEASMNDLKQSLRVPMDRALHAKLLHRLKNDGAKVVVMDLIFSDPGPDPESDDYFSRAIRENGRVILGVDFNLKEVRGIGVMRQLSPLNPLFEVAAAGRGLDLHDPDSDFTVRRHFGGFDKSAEILEAPRSLSWVAAQFLDVKLTQDPAQKDVRRWLWYYGPQQTIPHVTYKYALDHAPVDFFKNKVVFIGARPGTTGLAERRDEFRSPFQVEKTGYLDFQFMPAVEIHATEFLNLERGDWLTEPSRTTRLFVLGLVSFIFGFGLIRFRPLIATGLALIGGLVVVLAAQSLFVMQHIWFPWLIIIVVQIPLALLGSIVYRSLEWIIQRRKLEEERRQADARIREQAALLDKAQDAIIVHDLDWKPVYWNKSAEKLYGWTAEEMANQDLRAEVYKTGEAKLLEIFQTVINTGEWLGELKQANKAGKLLTVQSRWTLVRDEKGAPKSIFVINTDVTDQKLLEAQFLRTQRMESIGTLAGGIAHDLNNVLSPIIMGVELLKMKVPDEHSQKLLATMAGSVRRGADMVKQVLTFARGQSGERTLVQVKHLIREMQKIAKETFPKTIDVQVEVENVRPIMGDGTQIHQILLNLCVNARDAMPNGGNISMTCTDVTFTQADADKFVGAKPGPYVLLCVRDSGTGIPPEIIDRIFEPFFTTKEIGKGTGLGLSTVISIIKSHGGFLDLQSTVGKGTAFNVYLPAVESKPEAPSGPTMGTDLRGKGETLMLVDDEPALVELTKTILTHHGYNIVTASHGADALALHAKYRDKIKVVLMDMMMPVMDGPTAINELKLVRPDLPMIAISGLTQSDQVSQRLGALGIPFLPKPFDSEKLLTAIRKVLTKAALAPAPAPTTA